MTVVVVAGVLALAAVAVPRAGGGPLWDLCPDRVTDYRDHVVVRGPKFTFGSLALSTIATDPQDVATLAGTNGSEVHVSDDLGCTWTRVFAGTPAGNGTMTVLAYEDKRLRALLATRNVPLAGNDVYTFRLLTRDAGAESTRSVPTEMAAQTCNEVRRCFARFAPGRNLAVGYLVTPGLDGLLARVGSTTDGGATWDVHDAPTAFGRTLPVTDLAVDPADDAHILAVAADRLFGSHDRGETWTEAEVPVSLTPTARVVFARQPSKEALLDSEKDDEEEEPPVPEAARDAVIVDRASGGSTVLASRDGGATFVPTGVVIPADPVRDVVEGPSLFGPSLVVAAGGRLFRENPEGRFDTIVGQAAAIAQVAPGSVGMWLQRSGALAFVDGLVDPDAQPLSDNRNGGARRPPLAGALRGRAGGGQLHVGERVTVPPGGTGTGIVTADLGRQPRGLDVFLLFDTSGSMSAKIQPMGQALSKVVEALNKEGIAARFGLGEIGSSAWRYRRHADLGTPPEEVQRRIAALQGSGGEEYHYTAFYQIATGKGMQAVTGGSIPPGQQASYEPGALHILLTATDETDNTDPEGPTEGAALAALNDADIRHIGIYPYDGSPRDASADPVTVALRRYAEGTSTFAPPGGLDCEGDGRIDLPEGEPIACAIPGNTSANAPIATLLERVLLSLANDLPVSLEHGPSPLGIDVFPLDDYSALDMHQKHTGLEFRVQVTCPPDRQGTDVEIPLELHVGGVAVAAAPLPVTCLAPAQPPAPAPPSPPEVEQVPPRRVPPRLLTGLPPAASTPPALAQSTAAAEASSGASSSAQAVQAGMAWAPEDVPQVAVAHEDDTHFVRTGGGAFVFVVTLALLYAVEPRVAISLARVRNRRDPRW